MYNPLNATEIIGFKIENQNSLIFLKGKMSFLYMPKNQVSLAYIFRKGYEKSKFCK